MPELTIVNDVEEWAFLKRAFGVDTPLHRTLFARSGWVAAPSSRQRDQLVDPADVQSRGNANQARD